MKVETTKKYINTFNFNKIIVTAYSPFGNIRPNYKIIKKYEEKVKKVKEKYNGFSNEEYEKRQKAFKKLLDSFVTEVLGE